MQNIEKSLEDYSKKGKKFDMFKLMGIDGNLTKEQKENISNASKQIADDIGQMADFVVEQYQRQIDKKQEVIDQYTNEIEDLESRIESEKELRDEGLANNVDVLEKDLEICWIGRNYNSFLYFWFLFRCCWLGNFFYSNLSIVTGKQIGRAHV